MKRLLLSRHGTNMCTIKCLCISIALMSAYILMFAYIYVCLPSAYVHLFMLMVSCDCLCCLCMLMFIHLSAYGSQYQRRNFLSDYEVWKKGKVFNLVLYQERRIYVYKRTCPPTILSFFSFFFTQRLVFLSNTTMSLFVSDFQSFPSAQPSQAPPVLVQPCQACPARFLPLP
jgi:hypothetical protein